MTHYLGRDFGVVVQFGDSEATGTYVSLYITITYDDTKDQRRANNSKTRKNPWKIGLFQYRAAQQKAATKRKTLTKRDSDITARPIWRLGRRSGNCIPIRCRTN